MAVQTKDRKVSKMTRTNNKQAKHMSQNATRGGKRRGTAVVALAIAGVLAIGGATAVCVAGLGKSPGQAPAAAQVATAQKTTPQKTTSKAKATTPAKAAPAKAEAKQAEKPAQQQAQAQPAKAEAKPAQQAQPAKTAKQQAQPQQPAKQQAQPQAEQAPGTEAQVSREQCIAIACAHVGAGGAAKGEAQNVRARGPVTGGGTVYYEVELDLGDVHYGVTVDATDGHVIGADQTHAGTRTLLDEQGNPVEGTEWPVSA